MDEYTSAHHTLASHTATPHTRTRTQTLLQRDGRVPAGVAYLHPEAYVRQQLRVVVDQVDGQEGRLDALDAVLLTDLRVEGTRDGATTSEHKEFGLGHRVLIRGGNASTW